MTRQAGEYGNINRGERLAGQWQSVLNVRPIMTFKEKLFETVGILFATFLMGFCFVLFFAVVFNFKEFSRNPIITLGVSFGLGLLLVILWTVIYCKERKPWRTTVPEVGTLQLTTSGMNPHLRVDMTREGPSSTTTTTSTVRLSDKDNAELPPPSYSEAVSEGLPTYGQASNCVKSNIS